MTFVGGLTVAALFAGAGLAARPDDRAGMLGVGSINVQETASIVRPDDRATVRGPGALALEVRAQTAVRPDDRAGTRGPGPGLVVTTTSGPSDDSRFDWSAAAIGASSALMLAFLIGISLVSARHFRGGPMPH
jgi:hypothetical protein